MLPVYLDNTGIRDLLETLSCLLLLAITLRQLNVFWLLTMCAETLTSLGNLLIQ